MAGTPAKTILKKSLQEIEDGNWKKGTWGIGKANGKCDVEFGCAMGMVAIYGGEYIEQHGAFYQDGSYFDPNKLPTGYKYVAPRIPSGSSPSGVQKAVKALFAALPTAFVRDYYDGDVTLDDLTVSDMVNACVEYNDRDATGKGRAVTWFRKAIETLPTIK